MRLPSRVTSTPSGVAAGHVDVQQRARRQRHLLELLDEARRERAAVAKSNSPPEAEVELPRALTAARRRSPGTPRTIALQRGGDGAGVGDVVAEVGAVVDPGDDEVGLEAVDQAERGEAHAVHRRAVGGVADACRRRNRSPRPRSGRRVVIERAVAERLESGAMTASSTPGTSASARRSACRPVGVDAVVVGEQDLHLPQDRGGCRASRTPLWVPSDGRRSWARGRCTRLPGHQQRRDRAQREHRRADQQGRLQPVDERLRRGVASRRW